MVLKSDRSRVLIMSKDGLRLFQSGRNVVVESDRSRVIINF